jgi:5'-3' exonuclease
MPGGARPAQPLAQQCHLTRQHADAHAGAGHVTALKLVKKHGSIEGALAALEQGGKLKLPDPYPCEEARKLFLGPSVVPAQQLPPLKWAQPDEEGLVAYLCGGWVGGRRQQAGREGRAR